MDFLATHLPSDLVTEIKLFCTPLTAFMLAHTCKYLLSLLYPLMDRYNVCQVAGSEGSKHLLKWCVLNGYPHDSFTCAYAAAEGHLDVLQWYTREVCKPDTFVSMTAASNGQLAVLKWIRENKLSWYSEVTLCAARGGHTHVLEYLSTFEKISPRCYAEAAVGDQVTVLEWLLERQYDVGVECHSFAATAASKGSLNALKWLHQKNFVLIGVFFRATSGGHLHVLKWAKKIGLCCHPSSLYEANSVGHVDVVKWLVKKYGLGESERLQCIAKATACVATTRESLTSNSDEDRKKWLRRDLEKYLYLERWFQDHPCSR